MVTMAPAQLLGLVALVGLSVWGLNRYVQYKYASTYFGVLDIVRGLELPRKGVIVRGAIPFFTGFIVEAGGLPEATFVSMVGCGLGAFLLVWVALSDNRFIPAELQDRTLVVRVTLLMFIATFVFLGGVGVQVSMLLTDLVNSSWLAQQILSDLASHLFFAAASGLGFQLLFRNLDESAGRGPGNGGK